MNVLFVFIVNEVIANNAVVNDKETVILSLKEEICGVRTIGISIPRTKQKDMVANIENNKPRKKTKVSLQFCLKKIAIKTKRFFKNFILIAYLIIKLIYIIYDYIFGLN
ncbi:hypothetical protein Lmede01_18150 [Leuconostoc mesenteroides subsp. dextranicum]|nr:hypothetical protein Lmede01_18150 [Leuconostoc mesenteroides subsp. dextranicum]